MTQNNNHCSIEGCASSVKARGWCELHYRRWLRHDDPMVTEFVYGRTGCSMPSCEGLHKARGLCARHYKRWLYNGDPSRTRKSGPRNGNPRPEDKVAQAKVTLQHLEPEALAINAAVMYK